MADRYFSRGKRFWGCVLLSGIFPLFFSASLVACTPFSSNCSGVNISCGGSTVLSPDETAQAQAVATVDALKKNSPAVTDPLSKQDSNDWGDTGTCYFRDKAYYVAYNGDSSGVYTCDANRLYFRDAAIQMDVTLISGNSAGIIFRASADLSELYQFMINSDQFYMGVYGANGQPTLLIQPTSSSAIRGLGQKNTLLVITKGDDFRFFINGIFVAETHDSTLATGNVGVSLDHEPDGEARFSNLAVYEV